MDFRFIYSSGKIRFTKSCESVGISFCCCLNGISRSFTRSRSRSISCSRRSHRHMSCIRAAFVAWRQRFFVGHIEWERHGSLWLIRICTFITIIRVEIMLIFLLLLVFIGCFAFSRPYHHRCICFCWPLILLALVSRPLLVECVSVCCVIIVFSGSFMVRVHINYILTMAICK